MRNDDILLNEAYAKVHQQTIEEAGVTRANLAGLGGAIKGGFGALKGAAQAGIGGIQHAFGSEKGQQNIQAGREKIEATKNAALNAKIQSILTSHTNQINNLSTEIINDLNRLNLNTSNLTPDSISSKMIEAVKAILPSKSELVPTKTPEIESESLPESEPEEGGEPLKKEIPVLKNGTPFKTKTGKNVVYNKAKKQWKNIDTGKYLNPSASETTTRSWQSSQ